MRALYEIDNAILECVDPETGEILDTEKLVKFLETLEEPEQFLRFREPELRKDEIKKALKDGTIIPGASLEETESVVIK